MFSVGVVFCLKRCPFSQIEEEKQKKRQAVKEERAQKRKKEKEAASKEAEPSAKKARQVKSRNHPSCLITLLGTFSDFTW